MSVKQRSSQSQRRYTYLIQDYEQQVTQKNKENNAAKYIPYSVSCTDAPLLISMMGSFLFCKRNLIQNYINDRFLPYVHHDSAMPMYHKSNKKHLREKNILRMSLEKTKQGSFFEVLSLKYRISPTKSIRIEVHFHFDCSIVGLAKGHRVQGTFLFHPIIVFTFEFMVRPTSLGGDYYYHPIGEVHLNNINDLSNPLLTNLHIFPLEKNLTTLWLEKSISYLRLKIEAYVLRQIQEKMLTIQEEWDEKVLEVVSEFNLSFENIFKKDMFEFLFS